MLRTILHTSEFQQHTQQDVNNLDESLIELTSRTVSSVCACVSVSETDMMGRHNHLVWFQTAVVQAMEMTGRYTHHRHTSPSSLAITAATSPLLQCSLMLQCLVQGILKLSGILEASS